MPNNKINLSKRFPNEKTNLSKRFPNEKTNLSKRFPNQMRKNKKAQVGETLTWVVATLIIIGTLLIFIYASIALAKAKSAESGGVKNKVNQVSGKEVYWIETKNEIAFSRESSNQAQIEGWINQRQTENEA